MEALVEDDLGGATQEDRSADGDHDEDDRVRAARRLDRKAMQRKTDGNRGNNGHQRG